MAASLVALLFGVMLSIVCCTIPFNSNHACLMVPPSVEECYRSYAGTPITHNAARDTCLQEMLWNTETPNNTAEVMAFFRDTFGPRSIGALYDLSIALPPSGHRIRREYRTMSDKERARFHNAMDRLYEKGILRMFQLMLHHSGGHLYGPSLLPWNRVFMLMFEEVLRSIDPQVFLPYWDSTIDNEMDNPVNSVLWTPKYIGTGTGRVFVGLGAGYVTHQGYIERDIGMRGRLFSKQFLQNMLSQCYLKDISTPTAKPHNNLVQWHYGGHIWIGGENAYVLTAAYDPLFYLHMAYVDYAWELFRTNQKMSCNVNPALDYPVVEMFDSHHADTRMVGLDWIKNSDGIQNFWTDNWFQYEHHPVCPYCCPNCKTTMYCDTRKNVCVARSRRINLSDRELFYESHELTAMSSARFPRNRGQPFAYIPSDGRYLSTAYADARRVAQEEHTRHSFIQYNDLARIEGFKGVMGPMV